MTIVEEKYKIEFNGLYFTLYVLKKEKSNKYDYVFYGYYSFIESVFIALEHWTKDKKYPFKDSGDSYLKEFSELKNLRKQMNILSNINDKYIEKYKTAINEFIKSQNRDT